MASLKQIEANRLNARKSTGPRSAEGKAASSMNAFKTGIDAASHIIAGEDVADLESLAAEYLDRFRPATPEERAFVDILIRDEWLLRRLNKVEAQLWQYKMDSNSYLNKDNPLGHVYNMADKVFARLQRRIDSAGRSYREALRELERLQAARPAAPQPDPPAQPCCVPQPVDPASRQIGFVPQTPPLPPEPSVAAAPRAEPLSRPLLSVPLLPRTGIM